MIESLYKLLLIEREEKKTEEQRTEYFLYFDTVENVCDYRYNLFNFILLNGSTRIRSRSFSESSISFFFTHCMPRFANVAVMVSLLISSVQTPLLQMSFPTNLCGCALCVCVYGVRVENILFYK